MLAAGPSHAPVAEHPVPQQPRSTSFTGGNVFIAEIYFVKTSPVRGVPFGGPIGDMLDPLTGEQVTPRIFGEFSLVVIDPVRFVVGYHGQAAGGDNDQTLDWIKGFFMNGVKTTLGELCEVEGKSVLQAVSLRQKLAQRSSRSARTSTTSACDPPDGGVQHQLLRRGSAAPRQKRTPRSRRRNAPCRVKQIGVAGAQADAQAKQFELDQKFGQDARYVKELAGNYQNYAAGQAMIGAGQGMAAHGVGDGGIAGAGAQMAMGVNMANALQPQAQGQHGPGAAPNFPIGGGGGGGAPAAQVTCSKCGTAQPAGKFCSECGTALAVSKKFCTGCGGRARGQREVLRELRHVGRGGMS